MDIRPILTTLLRHKTAAALIVLEIALSCAIICNALFLIGSRLDRIRETSGLAEDELVRVQIAGIGTDDNAAALTRSDLAVLRSLPGVKAATVVNQIPFVSSSWNSGISLSPEQERSTLNATLYFAEEQTLDTFGLDIVAGRAFQPGEFVDLVPTLSPKDSSVIITRSMAERLFPGQSAVGKSVYIGDANIRIVGVVRHLVRPSEQGGIVEHEYSMLFPARAPYTQGGNYLLRTDPARRAEVLKAAVAALEKNGPNRLILLENTKTMSELRDEYYREDRAMAWLLVAVVIALLVVTALGIVGLASFWVQQRTKQIGVRRALGATRRQILRYFQTENFLLAGIGIALGMLMAYGINQLLMTHYELPRLPASYLPIGAAALWLLGQIAVFGPARRAAAVPPAIATRNV
ncbi:MAG: ABC transporter permease [Pseudomonadota bacterium]